MRPSIWKYLAYFGLIYLFFLVLVIFGYPLAQQYAKPIAALIFPINEANSLMKNIWVMTGMYWGMITLYLVIMRKK